MGTRGYLSQDLEYSYRFNVNGLSTHIRSSYYEEIVFRRRNLKVNFNHSKNLEVEHLMPQFERTILFGTATVRWMLCPRSG